MAERPQWRFRGPECGKGWASLYEPLIKLVEEAGGQVLQVKEKFGTLRFYYGPYDDTIEAAVEAARSKSAGTCEMCGEPGSLRGGSWLKTLCDACQTAREERQR